MISDVGTLQFTILRIAPEGMGVAFKTPEQTDEVVKITGTCTMSGERKRVAEIIDSYLNIVHGVYRGTR